MEVQGYIINHINLTSKDYYDLLIKLENIIGAKANVTIKEIWENIGGIGAAGNESSVNKTISEEKTEKEAKGELLIWISIIAVIVGVILVYILKKRKNNK